jgi:hypothetical protein
MINGGYVLEPRCIKESEISRKPPNYREVWRYLIREANHKEGKSSGRIIKRGELFRSLENIQSDLSWYEGFRPCTYTKKQIRDALDWLAEQEMILKNRSTRGLIICVCNYDYYQNPGNYTDGGTSPGRAQGKAQRGAQRRSHTINNEMQARQGFEAGDTSAEGTMQGTTGSTTGDLRRAHYKQECKEERKKNYTEDQKERYAMFQDWVNENAPSVAKMREPFTLEQYLKLIEKHTEERIKSLIEDMENWEGLKKRTSAIKTFHTFNKRNTTAANTVSHPTTRKMVI